MHATCQRAPIRLHGIRTARSLLSANYRVICMSCGLRIAPRPRLWSKHLASRESRAHRVLPVPRLRPARRVRLERRYPELRLYPKLKQLTHRSSDGERRLHRLRPLSKRPRHSSKPQPARTRSSMFRKRIRRQIQIAQCSSTLNIRKRSSDGIRFRGGSG